MVLANLANPRATVSRERAKGFICECGKEHKFCSYVYAHWNEGLLLECDCKRVHLIFRGIARLKRPRKRR